MNDRSRHIAALVLLALACGACSAAGDDATVGRVNGAGGTSPGAGGAAASGGFFDTIDAGMTPQELAVDVAVDGLVVDVRVVACEGDCKDVAAVVRGGNAPYAYRWLNVADWQGPGPHRICPDQSDDYAVVVRDAPIERGEFRRGSLEATGSARIDLSPCPLPPDAGPGDTTVHWANWTRVTAGSPSSASAVISLPDGSSVAVTYDGEVMSQSTTPGATNNFLPETTYISPTVANAPPDGGMIAVSGSAGLTQTLSFSAPVTDPVIAVWSVGFGIIGPPMTLEFDAPLTLLSSGPNATQPGVLTVSGQRMTGQEGNGVVQLTGTFTALAFTVPQPEIFPGYGGITVGIRHRR